MKFAGIYNTWYTYIYIYTYIHTNFVALTFSIQLVKEKSCIQFVCRSQNYNQQQYIKRKTEKNNKKKKDNHFENLQNHNAIIYNRPAHNPYLSNFRQNKMNLFPVDTRSSPENIEQK